MKKEIGAALTIVTLLIISIAAYVHLHNMTNRLILHMNNAMQACAYENFAAAETEIENALQLWNSEEPFTHIFIRHSEVDGASDIFYDALSSIRAENKAESELNIRKLHYHISSIKSMEQITLRSVF